MPLNSLARGVLSVPGVLPAAMPTLCESDAAGRPLARVLPKNKMVQPRRHVKVPTTAPADCTEPKWALDEACNRSKIKISRESNWRADQRCGIPSRWVDTRQQRYPLHAQAPAWVHRPESSFQPEQHDPGTLNASIEEDLGRCDGYDIIIRLILS